MNVCRRAGLLDSGLSRSEELAGLFNYNPIEPR